MTKRLMIQGTMSGVGKSLLTAALCRIFWQDGYRVAPFKSQNMALNSYITENGLEMGRAQVLQAWAAGREPDVRMNPILLKPSSDVGSQLIVKGEVRGDYQASEYFRKKREHLSCWWGTLIGAGCLPSSMEPWRCWSQMSRTEWWAASSISFGGMWRCSNQG